MARVGVAATAPFGADVLERLAGRHDVAFLLTRPDRPRGRGRRVEPPPAKRTAELIPLCHPLPLTHVDVRADVKDDGVYLEAEVSTKAQTGVEMEALTAVSVAALTVYDMCKALDKSMTITDVRLELKTGGKSGDFKRSTNHDGTT